MTGFPTLLYKEVLRFWKVSFQTVAAPVLTAVLYLLIFGHVLEGRVKVYDAVGYTSFLIPGLVMMSVLQNAFANASSSLIQRTDAWLPIASDSPPLGPRRYAVGARPPPGPGNPRCTGTCITMQCTAPAAPMMLSQLICTTVFPGSAPCSVASAPALLGDTVAFVYVGIITTLLHITMLQYV